MHTAVKLAATLAAGTVLGLAATWASVMGFAPGGVHDGPWSTSLTVGSSASDPYTRAAVAVHGLLALNRSETLYYSATRDADGRGLNGDCSYEISGRDPDARWWAITAYGPDDFLIANPANRYSVAKTTALREPDGSFRIVVSNRKPSGNWIYVGKGQFSLSLRIYNPGKHVVGNPASASLPSIKRVGCA